MEGQISEITGYVSNLEQYFQYNAVVTLTYFFVSFLAFILNSITAGTTNKLLFSTYRSSLLNPLTYVRFFTHVIGHENWAHFSGNFLYILLIGPMIEEKFGVINLILMIAMTAFIIGVMNYIFGGHTLLGASGIVFMMIILSSFVNITAGKIPITLILICIFYVVNEFLSAAKNDGVSHIGHILGALCGIAWGFMYYNGIFFIF